MFWTCRRLQSKTHISEHILLPVKHHCPEDDGHPFSQVKILLHIQPGNCNTSSFEDKASHGGWRVLCCSRAYFDMDCQVGQSP